ncbi:MAG TPA: cytidylate kinase-like family protein [Candidatus Dormibacteraeota bacterium]|nr:cytidylate kinase-like family protein [Candidatus Dormibacteraeota bacterium]
MKGTVTIAATYGAGGSVIAPAVAKQLGLPFIERAIPVEVAIQISASLGDELADDAVHSSRMDRFLERLLASSGLFVGVPPAPEGLGALPEIEKTEAILRRVADTTGGVILGRAGVFVLKGRPDVLHVRLDGDVEARRRAAAALRGIDHAAATREQQQTDRARVAYIEHFYARAGAWNDARHYHVVLDSTALSLDACTEIIVRSAHDLFAASRATNRRS